MKEILFGWIIKGQYEISVLDSIIGIVEILIVLFLIAYIYETTKDWIEKIKGKKENKE